MTPLAAQLRLDAPASLATASSSGELRKMTASGNFVICQTYRPDAVAVACQFAKQGGHLRTYPLIPAGTLIV